MNWADRLSWEWAGIVTVAFPLALLLVNELLQRALRRESPYSPTLRSLRNLLLPAAGVAAMLHFVLRLPNGHPAGRVGLTAFWIAALFVALQFIGDVIFGAAPPGTWRANVPSLFRDLVRSVLVGIGGALIYSGIWGQELSGALTALGVGSLVIGLALQEPLGNVFSGLMLLFESPVALGEWIEVDSKRGRVVEMNWRAVNMETATRETIVVPNSALYKTSFANLSRPTPLRTLAVELSFGYNDAPSLVKRVLSELARETPGVLADPPPEVFTMKYADFAINYEVRLSVTRQEEVTGVRDEFMTRVWYAAQRAGLTIPYPIATEIGVEAREFYPAKPSPLSVLASHPRFTENGLAANLGMQLLSYTRGETLLRQGDEQDGLGLILEGKAVLRVTPPQGAGAVEIGLLGAGDFYGEHSILAGSPSNAALIALTEMRVALFDLESSRQLMQGSPKLAREVGETIDRRRDAVKAAFRGQSAGSSS
jgi:small-conductance mechanosensitive channel